MARINPEKPEPLVAEPKARMHSAVNAIFDADEGLREAVEARIRARAETPAAVASRARAAFEEFGRRELSFEERVRRNFVAPDADAAVASRDVARKGVARFRESVATRSITLHVNKDFEGHMVRDNAGSSTVDLSVLMDFVARKISGSPMRPKSDVLFTACRAELDAEKRLKAIMADGGAAPAPAGPGAGGAAGPGAGGPAGPAGDVVLLEADELVSAQVRTQMSLATAPETGLRYIVDRRADQSDTAKAIETFQLRSGPSDVTSFHDFNSLQIAFEHVWTQIFDGRLARLGEELYREYVKLEKFAGAPADDRRVDTIDDLKRLMDDIRQLSGVVDEATPETVKKDPGGMSGRSGFAPASANPVATFFNAVDPSGALNNAISDKTVEAIVNPVGAAVDLIKLLAAGKQPIIWEAFAAGPLPLGLDVIQVTIEENVLDPGLVEIVLMNGPNAMAWKGLRFFEYDTTGKVEICNFKISNDANDTDVWDRNNFNRLPLYTPQVRWGAIEFSKALEGPGLGTHHTLYVLRSLPQKLTDRSRVTFTWVED